MGNDNLYQHTDIIIQSNENKCSQKNLCISNITVCKTLADCYFCGFNLNMWCQNSMCMTLLPIFSFWKWPSCPSHDNPWMFCHSQEISWCFSTIYSGCSAIQDIYWVVCPVRPALPWTYLVCPALLRTYFGHWKRNSAFL